MTDTQQPTAAAQGFPAHPLLERAAVLADVPLTIEVLLDRSVLRLGEILALEPGSILTLKRSAGENIDVYANDVLLAFGEMVIIENVMGVRITDFRTED
jgi:flagellar motor switch protein FliN